MKVGERRNDSQITNHGVHASSVSLKGCQKLKVENVTSLYSHPKAPLASMTSHAAWRMLTTSPFGMTSHRLHLNFTSISP